MIKWYLVTDENSNKAKVQAANGNLACEVAQDEYGLGKIRMCIPCVAPKDIQKYLMEEVC